MKSQIEERDISGIAQQMLMALDLPPYEESDWVRESHQFVDECYSPGACEQWTSRSLNQSNKCQRGRSIKEMRHWSVALVKGRPRKI